ncbi:hypothetical protein NECAME_14023 [Necator americanus]|uniref:Uncharacterized protein n=1 Tax=Necator americanus TaxID=51031 RepID=W2SR44_NECAM|nr:hypothetical protein NECAME_14023 [Necator americanus]ETN71978.1 hypothetical protein NECAME_14023 [Necator americanus]
MLAMAFLCFYTAYLVIQSPVGMGLINPSNNTLTDDDEGVCDIHCGMDSSLTSSSPNTTRQEIVFGLTFDEIWQLRHLQVI